MPEIKNTFKGGKMNKDLDERLIPPGEYRDALNAGVGRSEGSDVGALENLLGNQLVGAGEMTVKTFSTTGGTPAVPAMTVTDNDQYEVLSYSAGGTTPPSAAHTLITTVPITMGSTQFGFTKGPSLPAGFAFQNNEQVDFTFGGNSFRVTMGAATNGSTVSATSTTATTIPAGSSLTFNRFYEFAGLLSTFQAQVSTSPYVVRLSGGGVPVGNFYGYLQPSILGGTVIPHVTASVENPDGTFNVTLSAAPPANFDATNGMGVYNLRYLGGGNAVATDTVATVRKVQSSDPAPAVGDVINTRAITSVTAVSAGTYDLVFDNPLAPAPSVGSNLIIPHQRTIPGIPAVPPTRTLTGTSNQPNVPPNGTCIGSIRNDATDRVYWFVTATAFDAIYEFNQPTGDVNVILRGNLNFSTDNLITGVNIIGDLLFWTDNRNEPRKLNVNKWRDADHSVIPSKIYGRDFLERDITVIKPHPKEGIVTSFDTDDESEQLPFEEIFPQFGYRYKYDDGEYSPFSFFTAPVFDPGDYDATEHYKEGYNKAIRNTVTIATIDNIPQGTEDVTEIDLLYTESISSTVYKLKTIVKADFGNRTNSDNTPIIETQVINKRSFYSAFPANQLTRTYDDVPRRAKAQEITANRLIYSNYVENYPQAKTADIKVSQTDVNDFNGLSVKSNRPYEVGVVYEDSFGRQGAILNGDNSSITTRFNSTQTQSLEARITTPAPDWATHFKYYVKDTSMDHHNFTSYNVFNDGEADKINSEFCWVQIPSNDRNKVSENTFLVPRRHTFGDLTTGDRTNTLGASTTLNNRENVNANAFGSSSGNGRDVLFWATGGVQRPSVEKYGATIQTGLNGDGGPMQGNIVNGVFTAPVTGTYTFVFEGDLSYGRSRSFVGRNNARMRFGASFQVRTSATAAGFDTNTKIDDANRVMSDIHEDNATGWKDSFVIVHTIDLEQGNQVRGVLYQGYRRRSAGRTFMQLDLNNITLRTVSTPVDSTLPSPPVELPSTIFSDFSRHNVIEIEGEAPEIVRAQLPVDLRRLGPQLQYNAAAGNTNNAVFLVQGFAVADSEDTANYTASSTELYYHSHNSPSGFNYYTLFSALNIILDREGLERLRTTEGQDNSALDPGDRTIIVDTSEIEGGLFFGIGANGLAAVTGTSDKIRINEIAIGFNNDGADDDRSIVRFTLEEPVGINPVGQDIAIFKGDVTENALKNLNGSFFVKIPRATGNELLPQIPSGTSIFDEDNNISILRTIWWETLPVVPESNLDLYWEATDSIPIAQHGELNKLDFYNCVAVLDDDGIFIETQRIYDRFNSVQMVKGVKANTPQVDYNEDRRSTGLIWSGIYNSRTGINRLNQFITADGIRKEVEPNYGSIQKLHTRDTNLIVLCEDKVFRILADKDALFNADGGGNVSASNAVLGQTTPYTGEYGISLNPESFASYGSRMYFSDKSRGVILRLSQNGLEEISRYGMTDYFRDELREITGPLWGSYDDYSNQYNIRLSRSTASFDDDVQGWPSRKSFLAESGLTLNNMYYTFNGGNMWVHNAPNVPRNNFYGTQYCSSITTVFNQEPSSIKNFKAFNYEGTGGWTAPLILTDQEAGLVSSFKNKEGKWFECVTSLGGERIIPIIVSLEGDGIEDFYDGDNVEDGGLDGTEYDFGDSVGDGVLGEDGTEGGGNSNTGGDGLGEGDGGGTGGGLGNIDGDIQDQDGEDIPKDGDGNPIDNNPPVAVTVTVNLNKISPTPGPRNSRRIIS